MARLEHQFNSKISKYYKTIEKYPNCGNMDSKIVTLDSI
jgi:hypothetical protein